MFYSSEQKAREDRDRMNRRISIADYILMWVIAILISIMSMQWFLG
jgi:hypothetical protein